MDIKLTIITTLVQSKSRKIQLDRFINYHIRLKCKIIIIKPEDVIINYNENNKNIQIISCSKNATQAEKFQLAYNNVTTPYISWVADDDFLSLDFSEKSINILDQYQNVAACNGLTIFQDENTGKRKNYVYSFEYYINGLKFKNIDISRAEILKFSAENYDSSVVHGVMRTNVFIEIIDFLDKNHVPTRWCDAILVFIIMMHGKIHYIKSISGIRSHDTRLLENDPNVYHKVEVQVTELIMDQKLINKLYDYYISLKGKISPKIVANILYYLLYSSRALENAREREYKKPKKYYMIMRSYLEVLKLRLFNSKINHDIKLAKKFMKKYSLKGN